MSQSIVCGCCWCNCGLDLGVYCSAACCSFWLFEPASMMQFDPQGYHCLELTQGLGCNLFCLGLEVCASPRIFNWSRKLNQDTQNSKKSQDGQATDIQYTSSGLIIPQWKGADSLRKEASCSVCLQPLPEMELECGHVFHRECILRWVGKNKSCPVCRADNLNRGKVFCVSCSQQYYQTTLQMEKKSSVNGQQPLEICEVCQNKVQL